MKNLPVNILPWEYRDALGYDGLPIDEDVARGIIRRVGVHAFNLIGDTPLSVAALLGRTQMVRWLLSQGAPIDFVAPGGQGKTPLIWACYQKRFDTTKLLLDAGASVEAADNFGNTPLANAFINCFTDPYSLAELLIQRGAVITSRVQKLGEEWDRSRFALLHPTNRQ